MSQTQKQFGFSKKVEKKQEKIESEMEQLRKRTYKKLLSMSSMEKETMKYLTKL